MKTLTPAIRAIRLWALLAVALTGMPASLFGQIVAKTKHDILLTEMPATVEAQPGATVYFWQVPAGVEIVNKVQHVLTFKAPDGRYAIVCTAVTVDFDNKKIDTAEYVGSFGVGKQPDDDDGEEDEEDSKAPFPAPGLTVMIVREAGDRITEAQRAIYTSVPIARYCRDKCHKYGGRPGYRILDDDKSALDLANLHSVLREAYGVVRDESRQGGSLPLIGISNGQTGYLGPLPATAAETLELIKRYG